MTYSINIGYFVESIGPVKAAELTVKCRGTLFA